MATRVLVPYFPAAAGETEAPAGHLHLLNLTDTAATARVAGRDRDGAAGANVFTSNSIPAHGSIRITAGHLEGGGEAGASNGLGDGRGVWSLTVTSAADLAVVAFEGAAPNLEPLPVETLPPLPPPAPEPEPEPQPEPIPTGPARVEIQGFEIRTNIETTRYEWSATVRNAGGVTLRDVYVHPRAVWQGDGFTACLGNRGISTISRRASVGNCAGTLPKGGCIPARRDSGCVSPSMLTVAAWGRNTARPSTYRECSPSRAARCRSSAKPSGSEGKRAATQAVPR